MRAPINTILHGDCAQVMTTLPPGYADFILTDPPYITRYRDRSGRTVRNDDNAAWLVPAFAEVHRVLADDAFCVSFYGWNRADLFLTAWRAAGLRPVGHIVFRKAYASGRGFLRYEHEQAYLLAKGRPALPRFPLPDVIDWTAPTGNRLHPTEKPVDILTPLIKAFCPRGGLVLDPFCGSGSTLAAARSCGREWLGIELDEAHHGTAGARMAA